MCKEKLDIATAQEQLPFEIGTPVCVGDKMVFLHAKWYQIVLFVKNTFPKLCRFESKRTSHFECKNVLNCMRHFCRLTICWFGVSFSSD